MSIIELLVVISIIGIGSTIAIGSFGKSRNSSALLNEQATVVRILEKARDASVSGVGTTPHGVHIDTSSLTYFKGPAFSGAVIEQVVTLPLSITTNQTGTDYIFSRIAGTSTASGIIQLKSAVTGATANVTISASGQVQPY